MKVRDLMRLEPKTATLHTPLKTVWTLIASDQIHIVPIVDEESYLKGIITGEDLLMNLMPDYQEFFSMFYPNAPTLKDIQDRVGKHTQLVARDVMNKTVYTVYDDNDVYKALSRMLTYSKRILPVVDNVEKLVGFIVEKDIFKYLFEQHKNIWESDKKLKS